MSPAETLLPPQPGVRAPLASEAELQATPLVRATCAHCGNDVPDGLVEPDAADSFCCTGCRAVHAILHGAGLDGYYALGERREAPVRPSGRTYEEFDHEAFRTLYVRRTAEGLSYVDLYLEGVHCGSCVWLVERVPLLLPGVIRAELNVRRALARIEWDDAALPLSTIARELDQLGYPPHPFRGVKAEELRRREDRAALARIGVAGAIAINVMLAALALYADWLGTMEAGFEHLFRWVSLLLTAITLAWPGRGFFTSAIAALRVRMLNMDVPIAIGLAAGFIRGATNTVAGSGPIYFDGLATLTFALLAGRYLQQRGQRAASDATELLHSLAPSSARVVRDGGEIQQVPAEALLPGMVLDVRAGDTLAADGVIDSGASSLDLSLLTGESRAVGVTAGERVYAGTVNLSSPLRVRVTSAGEESRLAALLRQVEVGARRRAPVEQLADRVAGWFVAAVLVLAAATLAVWWRTDPTAAVDHAIALLVVTCPCALALATPLAVSVAVGRAARAGILIKGGETLERLAQPTQLLLDKTGTITQARTALTAWTGPEWVRPLVLALEASSLHPVAEGFRRAWPDVAIPDVSDVTHTIGGGIEGVIDGRRVAVGSPAFVLARAGGPAPHLAGASVLTPVLVAVDGVVIAAAGFGDPLRPDARDAVAALAGRGWELGILSGDDQRVVDSVAATLDLDPARCHGERSPEDKLRLVEQAAARGAVVMVGDGVNDAAAMAAASVGIGVHGGAEACLATADVYLARPGLRSLVMLAAGADRTMRVIRRNVLFSVGYNVVGAGLAMAGVLTPLVAAVLMPLSSLTVVLASWRSTTFREDGA